MFASVSLTQHCAHIPFLSNMCGVVLANASYHVSFTGGRMRHSVGKQSSVGKFKRRVGLTHKVNLQRNRRGGIRL